MKIQKSIIAPKLAKIKSFIPSRTTIDLIQGVLFKDNYLAATNLEIGIKAPLGTDTDETFILPTRAIELIENLPEGGIEIITGKNFAVTIKSNHITNKFQSYDPALFPLSAFEIDNDNTLGKICSTALDKAIKSVIYAAGIYPGKPMLEGIYFNSSEGKLNLVGSDGYRLAWYRIDHGNEFRFIVPKSSIQKLLSLGVSGDIEIACNSRKAIFKTEDYTLYMQLMEGDYMNYAKIFDRNGNKVLINRLALTEALKRCVICMEKNKGTVKMQLYGEKLTISVNETTSEYEEVLKLGKSIDDPLSIAFNSIYLLDLLKSFNCEDIELKFISSVMPVIAEDKDLSAMILPLNL